MTTLVASRDISGKGYNVGPGQRFTVADDVAESLIARGLAVPYREPVDRTKYAVPAAYQTKDVTPDRRGQARK